MTCSISLYKSRFDKTYFGSTSSKLLLSGSMTRNKTHFSSISTEGTQKNRTGRWGTIKPFFQEKLSPCSRKCPGSIHIPRFMDQIQEEDFESAWRTICEHNPLPRITGRVCPHPCEEDCLRQTFDEPIAIQEVERFLGDLAFHQGWSHFDPPPAEKGKKIAVVGSGPSGIGCVYQLLKSGYEVSLFEAKAELGGLLRYGIPNFRLPRNVLSEDMEMILGNRVHLYREVKVGRDIAWNELKDEYQAIFLGMGAQKPEIPSFLQESLVDVMEGLRFLEFSPNLPFQVKNKRILVVGGGNTAFDVARVVIRLGGQPVILYRREIEDMPAFEYEIREAQAEGAEICTLTSPVSIHREGRQLTGMNCLKTRITETISGTRRMFETVKGTEHMILADAVITAFGHVADEDTLPPVIDKADGAVLVDAFGATNIEGMFVGGDLTPDSRTVIHALAAGKISAIGIDCYLKNQTLDTQEARAPGTIVQAGDINHHYFKETARQQALERDPRERIQDFKEYKPSLSPDAANKEAERCFRCGICTGCGNCEFYCPDLAVRLNASVRSVQIDKTYCKGCSLCVQECPRGVMSMEVIE